MALQRLAPINVMNSIQTQPDYLTVKGTHH